jgi:hypothetical protein
MSRYTNIDEFRAEHLKSKEQGFINEELDSIFDQMINNFWNKYPYYQNLDRDKHIIIWNVKRRLNNLWSYYNTEQHTTNIFAYFSEILKRLFALTYNNLKEIKIEYIKSQRKEKLRKISLA